ncbi:MAG: prenyltransferase/squalene oxidase repeat-containing protein [Armatimonadota bacterium]
MGYLDLLDEMLLTGIEPLSTQFVVRQIQFVSNCQLPGGGFPGRQGNADLYYTDFAARILALLDPRHPALSGIADYINQLTTFPRDPVECFCLLNSARNLRKCCITVNPDNSRLAQTLMCFSLPAEGFARAPGGEVSAYITFLSALCYEMLEMPFPSARQAASRISELRCPDGGYGDLPGQQYGQTNATAAALAFLTMQDSLHVEDAQRSCLLLAGMQAQDGGFLAHAGAPVSDLLSTFTGLLTLAGLDGMGIIDLGAVARFLKLVSVADGGFCACGGDSEADVEYTYYGIGSLALLRAHLLAQQGE